jgi:hypothetical protein
MNRTQKIAKFNLITCLTALTLSLITFVVFYFIVGQPIHRARGGFGFIGICGFSALAPLIYKKNPGKVSFDERDVIIQKKASLGAYSIFWALFVLAAMIPFFILGPKGTISVKYLTVMVFGGIFVVILVQSIITLEEYGWSDKGDQNE